jgi:hypothetical protein
VECFLNSFCVDFEVAKIKIKTFSLAEEKVTNVTYNKNVFIYQFLVFVL